MRVLLVGSAALLTVTAASAAAAAQTSAYDRGVAARLAGDVDGSVRLLREAATAEPGNADAHLQLGLALSAAGQLDEAERELRRTLELAPDYQDAKDALARLEARRRDSRRTNYRSRIDVDGSFSAIGDHAPDWADESIRLSHQVSRASGLSGAIEPSHRFGRTDIYGELRLDQRISPSASSWIAVGGTPGADFRPKWQIAGGGSFRVSDGPYATVLTLEGREADYRAGDIQTLNPGIEQYVGGGSWITARMINVFDDGDHHSGWLARGDWMESSKTRLFAGAADAPDLSEGVVTRVFSLFGGVSADVSDRTTLRMSLTRENREDSPNRVELSAGVGWRF